MKKTLGVLAFLSLLLIGLCAWQARELALRKQQAVRAQTALQEEQRARAEQETASRYLEKRERDWKEKAMQLSALVGTLRGSDVAQVTNSMPLAQPPAFAGSSPTNDAAAGPGGIFGKGMGAMMSKMLKDPSMKEMMRAQQKVMMKKMYGPLIADLKLPPEQEQKLSALLLDQQMQTLERSQDMFKEDGVDFKKIAEASKDTQKASDAAIQEVLGPEKFEEFQEYKKTMAERMQLTQFKEQLQETGSPLREDQTKQMLVLLKEEKERYPPVADAQPGGGKDFAAMFEDGAMERQMEWQEQVNQRVQERAASILTPEQLKIFADTQQQQLSMQKFGIKMAREMFGKGGVGPAPVPVPAPTK